MRYTLLLPSIFKRGLIITTFTFASAFAANAAFGDLDNSFGSGGVYSDTALQYTPTAVARQSDGKLLVAGDRLERDAHILVLRRYNSDGSVDLTFGDQGTAIPYNEAGTASQVLVQADGKIVVIGSSTWRFRPNGWYDSSFGYFGRVPISGIAGAIVERPRLPAVVPLKVITMSRVGGSIVLQRLRTNGTVDNTFGSGGHFTSSVYMGLSGRGAFAIHDGSIFISGGLFTAFDGSIIQKISMDGQYDQTFGLFEGIALIPHWTATQFFGCGGGPVVETVYNAIAVQSNGRIIARDRALGSFVNTSLVPHDANGSLDATFATNLCTGPYNANQDAVMIVQRDDRVLDCSADVFNGPLSIDRYAADGVPEGSFPVLQRTVADMLEQPDRKILLVGLSISERGTFVTLSRHLPE